MALPKLPDIRDVIEDPSIVDGLPMPLLLEMVERLKQSSRSLGGATNVPDTPIEMALQNPKFQWMDAPHLHFLADKIVDAMETHRPLIVCMPFRHAKSHTCSIWTPFWALARNPELPILLISAERGLARKWGGKVRRLVQMYGDQYNLKLNPKKLAEDDWELTTGGGMNCVGVGGMIAGKPAKLMIIDDAVKNDEDARSEVMRDKTWDWWEETAMSRIEPDTVVIVIGTRWHDDDFIGRLIKNSAAGTGLQFTTVILPAIATGHDPLDRMPGECLWPSHFPQAWYEHRQSILSPYAWSAGYQQNPNLLSGNMVDPSWWRYYRPSELPTRFDQEIQTWDISLDAETKNDSRHAGAVISRLGALFFIRAGFAEHCDINKVITTIRTWNMLYPRARQKLIERATAGVALSQTLRQSIVGLRPWPPKGQQKGSKEACLDAVIPAISGGNVLLPMHPDGTKPKWVQEMVAELQAFPRGQYDDYVDCISQGLGFMLPGSYRDQMRAHDEANTIVPAKTMEDAHREAIKQMISKLQQKNIDAFKRHMERDDASPIPMNQGFNPRAMNFGGASRRRMC